MAIPDSPRVIYERSPLAEVVAQLRFPPILRIESEPPAAFQERVRGTYPQYAEGSFNVTLPANLPPQLLSLMQGLGAAGQTGRSRQFASTDNVWKATLTRDSLELKTSKYEKWEDFRARFLQLREAIEACYGPSAYSRVGLRYLNVIRRSLIGLEEIPWSKLLKPYVAGELSSPDLEVDSLSHQAHCRMSDANCFLTLKTGIALAEPTKEQCFLIDSDVHTHVQTEIHDVLDTLDRFNRTAGKLFRWCIDRTLHDALGPKPIDRQ